jgi:hypothetical protein
MLPFPMIYNSYIVLSYVSARQECCTVRYDKNFTYAVKKYRTCISTLATKFCGKIGFTLIKILTILRLLYNYQSNFSFISKPVSNQQKKKHVKQVFIEIKTRFDINKLSTPSVTTQYPPLLLPTQKSKKV